MKRRDLEKHLKVHGCFLHHHGGSHDIWINPFNSTKSPIPRHKDVGPSLAKAICRQLGIPAP